jgi:hypothetical protein
VKIKFPEWRKLFQTKNRIDADQKMYILNGIEQALGILFPNSNFERSEIGEEEADMKFDEKQIEQDSQNKRDKKDKIKLKTKDLEEEDDEEEIPDDEDLDALEDTKSKGFVDSGIGASDLSSLKFDDDDENEIESIQHSSTSNEITENNGPPPPPPGPPPQGMDGPPPPPLPGAPPPIFGEKSKSKLKRFAWDKIPQHKIKETFWRSVKIDGIKLDSKVLEKHFSVKEKAEDAQDRTSKRTEKISLVDIKRANNVGM